MATTLYLTNTPVDFQYDSTSTGGVKVRLFKLGLERGTSSTYETATQPSQSGVTIGEWPTELTYFRYAGDSAYIGWITDPVKSNVHISSFASAIFYGLESNAAANAKVGCAIFIIDRNGNPANYGASAVVQIGEDDAEMGTSIGALSFTLATSKTNRTVEVGERILLVPFAVDAASPMVSGYTLSFFYGGNAAYNGTVADPNITFTENIEFIDFISANPDNPQDNSITIGGVQFKTTGPVRINMSSAYPGKISQGDYGRNDNPRISTFSVSDLTGGHGVWKYKTQGGFLQDGDRYWTGKNIDPWPGALVLGPKVTTAASITPYTITEIWTGSTPTNYIFVTVNGAIYRSTNGTTFTIDNTSPIADFGDIKQVLQVGKSSVAFIGSSTRGGMTDVGTYTTQSAGADNFASMAQFDSYVYYMPFSDGAMFRLESSLSVGNGTPATAAAIAGDVFEVLSPNRNVELYTYEDASGFQTIWALTNGGAAVFSFDDVAWYKAKFDILPFKKRLDTGADSLAATFQSLGRLWKESLVYQTNVLDLQKLTMNNGQLLVEDMGFKGSDGIASDNTNTADYSGEIMQMCSDQEHFFAMVGKSAISTNTSKTGLFMTRGRGWHPIWFSSTQMDTYAMGTGSINGAKLYFGASATLRYIDIEKLDRAPYASDSIGREYNTAGGMVVLPYFDGGYEAQSKLALRLRVKMKSQTKGQTVQIQYRLNGSTAGWETLSVTTSTTIADVLSSTGEHILRFGRRNEGLFFNSIQFRINLATDDANYSPIVEYIEFEYLREPEVEKGFVVNIDMSTEFGGLTPQQQEDMLWMLIKRKELVMFSYKPEVGVWDDTNDKYTGMAQRSALVKVVQPDGISRLGADDRGQWAVYLVEMNTPLLNSPT